MGTSGNPSDSIGMTRAQQFIAHYGVPGMKWGVRKDKGREGERVKLSKLPKLDRKWEKKALRVSNIVRMQNAVADKLNGPSGGLNKVNNKPKYRDVDFTNPKNRDLHSQYMREITDTMYQTYKSVAREEGGNPSGSKRFGAKLDHINNRVYFSLDDVKHADMEENIQFVGVLDAKRFVISIEKAKEDSMGQSNISAEEYIAHYGVLGMRWGKRKAEIPASAEASAKEAIKAKAKAGKVKALSDKELITAINRMNLEQSFKRLAINEKPAVTRFLTSMITEIGKREVQAAAGKVVAKAVARKLATAGLG